MGREHEIGSLGLDRCNHFIHRSRDEGGLVSIFYHASLQYDLFGWDASRFEDLAPAVTEPAVANDQTFLVSCELSGDSFHPERTTTRNHSHGSGVVHALQRRRDIVHHTAKRLRHVVQGAVGVDHGVFQQSVGINVRQQSGHGFL